MTRPTIFRLGVAAVLTVFVYNTWSFCCGRCSAATFINPGPTGLLLLGTTVFALLAFFAVRWHRRRADRQRQCRCGTMLRSGWLHCPACGGPIARRC